MPNDSNSLRSLSEINICATHFDCEWKTSRGRSRTSAPPTVFPNVPNSSLKQASSKSRGTSCATFEAREEKARLEAEKIDKIQDFASFCLLFSSKFPDFHVVKVDGDFYVSKTYPIYYRKKKDLLVIISSF